MNKKLREILKSNSDRLVASDRSLRYIYEIMFSHEELILSEYSDGFRTIFETYGQTKRKIEATAAALFEKIGATHSFIALEIDNSAEWIVAFWAILMSGNKPYLVNMRYPTSLSDGILKTLDVKYTLSLKQGELKSEYILFSSLKGEGSFSAEYFEDEIAFSSSATSMNEVVCFYKGFQISEQILNFEDIVKREPRIAKHYKGSLKQLAFLPFYHIFGLFAVYFWFTFFGRTLVFLRDYSADTILKTCKKHNVTHIFAVPVLWHTIEKQVLRAASEQGDKRYKKLQKALKFTTLLQNLFPSCGAEIAKSITKEVTDKLFGPSVMFTINGGSYIRDSALYLINGLGYSLHNGYGMSELGITSVELRRKAFERNQNSIGRPFASVEYKIDEDGVLKVRGSSICTRKLINGREEVFDGWFNTGDQLSCDKDGNYFIHGREGDVVIGENGENINPDNVEKAFALSTAKHFSVLGLKTKEGEALSIVIEVSPYATEKTLRDIIDEVYSLNDTLSKATAIKNFYFTNDPLCPPTAIKVSRAQLSLKIEKGEVRLIPFSEMKGTVVGDADSPLVRKICEIIGEVLDIPADSISPTAHVFYDLGASSIQYFSILTRLSEEFDISDYDKNDKYCYTPFDISEYIERHL